MKVNYGVKSRSLGRSTLPGRTNPELLQFRSINQGVVMTENTYLTQTQLAERWQVAESTLERWRSEGIGPIYMKMMGRVRIACPISRTSRRTPYEGVRRSVHQHAVTGRN